jgi:hypothetical protein
LLKQAIPSNPNNTSVEEIDAAITTFTSTIIRGKKKPRNYFTHTHLETRPSQISRSSCEEKEKQGKYAQF